MPLNRANSSNLGIDSASIITNLFGTANQIIVTPGPGAGNATLSTPQDIAPTSNVNFNNITSTGEIQAINVDSTGVGFNHLLATSSTTTSGLSIALTTVATPANTLSSSAVYVGNQTTPDNTASTANITGAVIGTSFVGRTPTNAITWNIVAGNYLLLSNESPGTVTSMYGMYLQSINGAVGTVTTAYGIRLENVISGTTNWALYSEGGQSSHAGNFRFGSNLSPTATVDVTGTLNVSSTVNLASLTASRLVSTDGSQNLVSTSFSANGQLPIGSSTGGFTLATITAGTGITVTNGAGSITIASTASGTFAPIGEAYVTIGNTAGLTAERALTGTASQVIITDNGANSTVVLSLPQSIATSSNVTFANVTATAFIIGANTLNTSEWANLDGQDQTVATGSSPTFVGATLSGLTASRLVSTSAGSALQSEAFTANGQLLIGSATGAFTKATITAGTGVTVTNGAGSITLSVTSGTFAPIGEAYVTIGNTAGLTAERALTGTSNQVVVTDNGANSTVVLSTPQDIATSSSPTFADLTLTGGDLIATTTTTFNLINATQTTINFGGAATTLSIGAATGTATFNNTTLAAKAITASTTLTVTGDTALNGANVTTSQTTINVFNGTATTGNLFGAATTLTVGATTGTLTIRNTTLSAKAGTFSTTLAVTGNAGFGASATLTTTQVDVIATPVSQGIVRIGKNAASSGSAPTTVITGTYLTLGGLEFNASNASPSYRLIGFGYNDGPTKISPAAMGFLETNNSGDTIGALVFLTRSSATGTVAPTERMRINATGEVGIGMTAVRQLDVTGTFGATGAVTLGSTLDVTGIATFPTLSGVSTVSAGGETAFFIRNTSATGSYATLYLQPTSTAGENFQVYRQGGTNAAANLDNTGTGSFHFRNAGTVRMSISSNGLFTEYNDIGVVGNGVPSILASSNLTAQSAAIAATTIYAIPAGGAGMYRITWSASITTAATVSSALGGTTGFRIVYTDPNDSVVKTSNPTTATVTAGNTTATSIGGVVVGYCAQSTNLQYSFGYTSTGATAMVYDLSIRVEAIG